MIQPRQVTSINPRSPVPKWAQLRDILVSLVDSELTPDEPIPSERELSERFGVSRMTARQAVDQLVSEGRLYRVAARGTFVAPGKLEVPMRLTSFSEDMRSRGMTPGSSMLGLKTETASAEIAQALGLPRDGQVHVIERLRTADERPMAIERAQIAAHRAPHLFRHDLLHDSLYAILEREYDLVVDGAEQEIEAGTVAGDDAELLDVPAGAPVLHLTRRSFSGGTPIEHVRSTYRGDRFRLHAKLGKLSD
jgi:GntR family transcriptional regulator